MRKSRCSILGIEKMGGQKKVSKYDRKFGGITATTANTAKTTTTTTTTIKILLLLLYFSILYLLIQLY